MTEKMTYKNYSIEIDQDMDPESPRDWCNLGTMICWHNNYILGDKHDMPEPDPDFINKNDRNGGVSLPLYLYDHSGITMSTSPFSCPWDSGQVGWIYADSDTLIKEYGKNANDPDTRAKAIKVLQGEVETYDQYLTGDVWGYTINDPSGDTVGSLWGMYGFDYCELEAKAVIDLEIASNPEQLILEV